jgi:thiamine-phosphate pyrophosphorylase
MIRCFVTDRRQGDLLDLARQAIASGVDMIQVREKDLPVTALLKLVSGIRDLAAGTATRVLVNDRLDVALAAKIDGLHLPARGLPALRVRPFVKMLGVSTHTPEEVIAAERAGADFVIFGPIFETPGKAAIGLPALRSVTASVRIPVLAIGGMNQERATAVLEAGAAGIAGIRMFSRIRTEDGASPRADSDHL